MGGSKDWLKIGVSTTSPTSEVKRKEVKALAPKTENVIFIGSEMSYDSFWLKMMFMASAYVVASGGQTLRAAHKKTIAFVDEGYTKYEKLPLEALKKLGYQIVGLHSSADLIACLSNDRNQYKLQDVAFFSHGVIGEIALNYKGSSDVTLSQDTLLQIPADAFVEDGRIFSYACRTGTGAEDYKLGFKSLAAAKPQNSLAQKMANHFGVSVSAFMRRTYYGDVLRNKAQSQTIGSLLQEWRKEHDGVLAPIPPEHEGLPHLGLADSWNPWSGAKKEGTDNYALWRKRGGLCLPTAAESPSGVPAEMRTYTPAK